MPVSFLVPAALETLPASTTLLAAGDRRTSGQKVRALSQLLAGGSQINLVDLRLECIIEVIVVKGL